MHYCALVLTDDINDTDDLEAHIDNLMAPFHDQDETYFTRFHVYDFLDQDVARQRAEYEANWTHIYEEFEDYTDAMYSYSPDPVTGMYGEWENPEGHCDGWEIGGRYSNTLPTVSGDGATVCRVQDLSFEPDEERRKKALRAWEIIREGQPPREGEDGEEIKDNWGNLEAYADKQVFADHYATLGYYVSAMVINGRWIDIGSVTSEITPREAHVCREILHLLDPEKLVVVVDCHW